MTCPKSISVFGVALCSLLAFGIVLGAGAETHADTMPSLFNGMVFAHDVEKAWIHAMPDPTPGPAETDE